MDYIVTLCSEINIGMVTNNEDGLNPSDKSSGFFLNTRDPADANGTITSVRYCYTLPGNNTGRRVYQATDRRQEDNSNNYLLVSESLNITIEVESVTQLKHFPMYKHKCY